jgi:NADPH:quinone reductase-like Zn-dependent oxidoreductase
MKAVVYTEYGSPDVLQLKDVPKPAPKENEILVRVCAAAVGYGDLTARNFAHLTPDQFNMPALLYFPARLTFGWNKPKINILGSQFAGVIEAVGRQVSRFTPGDQVMGYLGQGMGAYAEYVCMPENGPVVIKPANKPCTEAAALPYGALMATDLLRKAHIQRGHKVLILGASGGIGSAAVQLARHAGSEVTGVCGTPRLASVKALGADFVLDYTQEDFTQNGETYDLILDVLGKSSFAQCKNSLKPNGIYLLASFKMQAIWQMLWTKIAGGKKVICALASEKPEDLLFVKELVEAGKFKVIVDKTYPLAQAAEAHRYAEAGLKKGNVVITFDSI